MKRKMFSVIFILSLVMTLFSTAAAPGESRSIRFTKSQAKATLPCSIPRVNGDRMNCWDLFPCPAIAKLT